MNVSQITFHTSQGQEKKLADFAGKTVLIVNIASQCAYTPQLGSLEKIYQEYKNQGLEILAFPSDDFNQEPLNGDDVVEFCASKYGVSFPVMEKCHVKGPGQHPLFEFLGNLRKNGKSPFRPYWNFFKYLVDREGELRDYFLPFTSPDAPKMRKAIQKLL